MSRFERARTVTQLVERYGFTRLVGARLLSRSRDNGRDVWELAEQYAQKYMIESESIYDASDELHIKEVNGKPVERGKITNIEHWRKSDITGEWKQVKIRATYTFDNSMRMRQKNKAASEGSDK